MKINLLKEFILFAMLYMVCSSCMELSTTELPPSDVVKNAADFLKRFGYLKEDDDHDVFSLEEAIRSMQTFAGIEANGQLDDATLSLMKTPRCSVRDMDSSTGTAKRFSIISKWSKTVLDWKVHNYPNRTKLTNADVNRIISNAFKIWANAGETLSFPASSSDSATLNFWFFRLNHTDKYPFDGPGKTLGHSFYPQNGNIHFDDDETWTENGGTGIDMAWVATHEIGHALGLGHSTVINAMMYPYYSGYIPLIMLDYDDVSALLQLYPN